MNQKTITSLYIAGILIIIAWWISDGGWEPPSVLVITVASLIGIQPHGNRKKNTKRLSQAHSSDADAFGLVQRFLRRSIVLDAVAPTRNELAILLLARYPNGTGKGYLRRSLRCITQTLDEALQELIDAKEVIKEFGTYKLTDLGLTRATEVAHRYARANEHRTCVALTRQIHRDAKKRHSFVDLLFAASDLQR